MNYIGIDIGSTASKVAVLGGRELLFVLPTGWNSKETAGEILSRLKTEGVDAENKEETRTVATGYGRIAVEYADKVVTEITCHARGGREFAGDDCSIIDVGGQDTKVITVEKGMVSDFLMNDKCSAGTGKFLEIMSNRLGVYLEELFRLAEKGTAVSISSLCTVFAESEIISLMGEGRKREDIAAGIVESVASKVSQLAKRQNLSQTVVLTGGLSVNPYFAELLAKKIERTVIPAREGRFAGAIGAALLAQKL